MYHCTHFSIKELVSPIVYNKFGENSWQFFNEEILKELDFIRESYYSPIIINNWSFGGNLKQCGLRSNLDEIVKNKTNKNQLYLSAHVLCCAFDLHCKYGHNDKLFNHVYNLIKNKKLKQFKRLENFELTKTYVHTDCFNSQNIIFS